MADCPKCDVDHRPGSPLCPGQRVDRVVAGKYRLTRLLGMGGMGAVYAAEHLTLKRLVALKMLHARFSEEPEIAERFQREARETAGIGHPGIVEVRDLGRDSDGALYLEMELLEGAGVDALIRQGPLPVLRAVEITLQTLDALKAAHGRGIIHRDLKPENLFLARTPHGEQVKILDFGLAKLLDGKQEGGMTHTGVVMGTPIYMSPDQLRDAKRVDERGDLYSLGGTLYAMLTGRPPVDGSSVSDVLFRLAQGEVNRNPRGLRPELPQWLDRAVAKALAQDPAERFQNAEEMRQALLAGRGVAEMALESTVPRDPTDSKAQTTRRAPPLTAGRAGLGAAVVLVGVAAVIAWRLSTRQVPVPGPQFSLALPAGGKGLPSPPSGMALVRGATFQPGSTPEEIDAAFAWCKQLAGAQAEYCSRAFYEREAQHGPVTVAPFFLDQTEVTNGDFAAWLDGAKDLTLAGERLVSRGGTLLVDLHTAHAGLSHDGGHYAARAGASGKPVVQVTWAAAVQYCAARKAVLPSEWMWELAARGPFRARFPWGNDEPRCDGLTFARGAGQACAALGAGPVDVGTSARDRSPQDIADLGGNVAEWTADRFDDHSAGDGKAGPYRVVRGGHYEGLAESLRSAARSRLREGELASNIGFRCALPIP